MREIAEKNNPRALTLAAPRVKMLLLYPFPFASMRRTFLSLAVVVLAGCSWLSTGLPPSDAPSSAPADTMLKDDAMKNPDWDDTKTDDDAMMQKDADAMMGQKTSSAAMMQKERSSNNATVSSGMYAAYHDGVIGNGETSVLFFHAAWCPFCKQADKDLTQWYGSTGFPLSVYKVDYDTQTELKARYGVTTQHTFVKIDGSGNAVKTIVGPSNTVLQAFLGA